MSHFFGGVSSKLRDVMGVIVESSGGATIEDEIAKPTALIDEVEPLSTQHLKDEIQMRMAIDPAPRKSGEMGLEGDADTMEDEEIGPPDATVTSRRPGLAGMLILIGTIITVLVLIRGGNR